jgi:hypothetical protein
MTGQVRVRVTPSTAWILATTSLPSSSMPEARYALPVQTRLPFEVREAIVEVCGKAFWLKDPLKSLLVSGGVPVELVERYWDESKYKIVRHILSDLDAMGEEGWEIQRRLVTELCQLRKLPDENVPDPAAGLAALRFLKELARDQKLVAEREQTKAEERAQEVRRQQAALAARAAKMAELRQAYQVLAVSGEEDPQGRGFSLEDLLAELFELHEIVYRRSYRTSTEQIDGHFGFKGFDYLVESRWRRDPPTEADLAAFKGKVDRKIQSTRGLFVSIPGFRQQVVMKFTQGPDAHPRGSRVPHRWARPQSSEGGSGGDHLFPAGAAVHGQLTDVPRGELPEEGHELDRALLAWIARVRHSMINLPSSLEPARGYSEGDAPDPRERVSQRVAPAQGLGDREVESDHASYSVTLRPIK